jgi:hypothetical protein
LAFLAFCSGFFLAGAAFFALAFGASDSVSSAFALASFSGFF